MEGEGRGGEEGGGTVARDKAACLEGFSFFLCDRSCSSPTKWLSVGWLQVTFIGFRARVAREDEICVFFPRWVLGLGHDIPRYVSRGS